MSREGRPAERERLWGAIVKADFIHHRCVVSPLGGPCTARRPMLLTWAALCLIGLLSTGCHFGKGHHAAEEPHYAQLEQACFGYEPTVWRTLPGQCEQAVRMIPDEVVQVPAATPAAPPADTKPGESVLDQVPEPGQRVPGLLRGILDEAAPPGETESPSAEPTPTPSANEPAAPRQARPRKSPHPIYRPRDCRPP